MTARHYEALQALKQCTFLPGSYDKRFVRNLSALPQERELTERQAANVERMAYRYRRQIGRLIFGRYAEVLDASSKEVTG